MEYGLRLARPEKLPADPREICQAPWRDALPQGVLRALYFGTEFCEDLLPSAGEAAAFCALADAAGLEAVLLTPIVTPRGLQRLDRLLAALDGRGCSFSVSFNDWGVLRLLRSAYGDIPCRAGRLINRGLRDPRLAAKATYPSSALPDRGEKLRTLLRSYGVRGVETDPDLDGTYLSSQASVLQRVLHLPYAFATSGRNCLIKAESATENDSFTKGLGKLCPALCRDRCLQVQRQDTSIPLWRAGNTLFYQVSAAAVATHLRRCDRVVLHERPMP